MYHSETFLPCHSQSVFPPWLNMSQTDKPSMVTLLICAFQNEQNYYSLLNAVICPVTMSPVIFNITFRPSLYAICNMTFFYPFERYKSSEVGHCHRYFMMQKRLNVLSLCSPQTLFQGFHQNTFKNPIDSKTKELKVL